MHYAAWGGQERATRELLVRGADPNARDAEGKTPLHFAVLGGHESTVGALCDHGANVSAADTDGQTPLHKAAAQDQLALTQELVARGADLTAKLQVRLGMLLVVRKLCLLSGRCTRCDYLWIVGNSSSTALRSQSIMQLKAVTDY